jgi:hypothetical protein
MTVIFLFNPLDKTESTFWWSSVCNRGTFHISLDTYSAFPNFFLFKCTFLYTKEFTLNVYKKVSKIFVKHNLSTFFKELEAEILASCTSVGYVGV